MQDVIGTARRVDSDVFFLAWAARPWSEHAYPLPHPTAGRAAFMRK